MRVLRGLSIPQRVVVIVGFAIALLIGWIWWYLGDMQDPGGWYAYAPSTQGSWTDQYDIVRYREPVHLAVALGLVVGWSAASIWLLGLRPHDHEPDPEPR